MDATVIKAILFDLDNTLIETNRASGFAIQKTRELLKSSLALDDDTVSSICDKFKKKLLHEKFDPAAGRSIDEVRVGHWDESIKETVDGSTPSLAAECYYMWKNSRLELLCLSPEICNLLKQLRKRYKLLLLTNGNAQTQREKVEAVGCERFFDAVVVGGDYAEQKPFPSIFRLCFDLLQVEARDCIMVGDSLDTDIQGGFSAQVRATIWINSTGDEVPVGSVTPDYTISTVLDLEDILARLN
ncbi:N-acylneuraminate-9-phosphatase [Dunckerocampus dactyliophorus]|uniref:N-acylneuraminate-9-phosphatase n=1 Tax=Dunckerocampus dactyliophorus TaxID=161453 RepID=UPI0024063DCA|nr:N-acylneuraminate-9-phosphatase [Dunckerocampus dactyliophorus]